MYTTVMEKLLEDCVSAYRNRKPLLFIDTDDMEIIRRILVSDRLVPRVMKRTGNSSDSDEIFQFSSASMETRRALPRVFRYDAVSPRYSDVSVLNVRTMGVEAEKYWSGNERFPTIFIRHVPYEKDDAFNTAQKFKLMEFVELFEREEDDNSLIRSSFVLLYGNVAALPRELRGSCEIVDVPLPKREEIVGILNERMSALRMAPLAEADARQLAYALTGFSLVEAERQIDALLSLPDDDTGFRAIYNIKLDEEYINRQKKQMLKRDNVLELKTVDEDLSEVGGMIGFMNWFLPMKECIQQSGRLREEAGVMPPKGVLMCGVPGCGKSLAAKQVSKSLNLPLLQLEMGRLMGRYVGESERNMARALKLAEAMAPCVLWIDEIEKGFSGGGDENGIFKRMLGSLLTWMQENTKPCFIFATANDITGMPKEFFRSGRFDELFAVYMPTRDECASILESQMKRVRKEVAKSPERHGESLFVDGCFDSNYLKQVVDGFSTGKGGALRWRFVTGADIEKLVTIAMRNMWLSHRGHLPITRDEWSGAIQKALDNTTVYGDGPENMDSIAACYLRLVRNNFRSSSELTLFAPGEYQTQLNERGEVVSAGFPKRDAGEEKLSRYDQALYDALIDRLNALAMDFERQARSRLVR